MDTRSTLGAVGATPAGWSGPPLRLGPNVRPTVRSRPSRDAAPPRRIAPPAPRRRSRGDIGRSPSPRCGEAASPPPAGQVAVPAAPAGVVDSAAASHACDADRAERRRRSATAVLRRRTRNSSCRRFRAAVRSNAAGPGDKRGRRSLFPLAGAAWRPGGYTFQTLTELLRILRCDFIQHLRIR